MLLQGLSEVVVGIHNSMSDDTITPENIFVLDASNGGPTGFNLQNLSPTATSIYGGDAVYMTIAAGTGAVQATFNALDLPQELVSQLMGYTKDKDSGIWIHGKDSRPAYASIMARSHDKDGKSALMGLFNGTFTRGDVNPQTNDASTKTTTDSLTFHASVNDQGFTYAEGVSGVDGVTLENFEKMLFKQAITRTTPVVDGGVSEDPTKTA
jgi:phage major tail protein, phi13 family